MRNRLATSPPSRLLLLTREHIGDILNTTASLAAIRAHFPDAKIVVEVGERAAPVLENFPGIDELWLRPTHEGLAGKLARIGRMRQGRFDACLILDDTNDMVLFAKLARIPLVAGIWRGRKYERLFDAIVPLRVDQHEVRDNQRDLLDALGIPTDAPPRLYPGPHHVQEAQSILAGLPRDPERPLAVIHPGSTDPRRRWPPERFGEIAQHLSTTHAVGILGGPGEDEFVGAVLAFAGDQAVRLITPSHVLSLAAVLAQAELFVGNDSGPMHIAGIMGCRVVAVFGPTNPLFTGPPGTGHSLIQSPSGDITDILVAQVIDALADSNPSQSQPPSS